MSLDIYTILSFLTWVFFSVKMTCWIYSLKMFSFFVPVARRTLVVSSGGTSLKMGKKFPFTGFLLVSIVHEIHIKYDTNVNKKKGSFFLKLGLLRFLHHSYFSRRMVKRHEDVTTCIYRPTPRLLVAVTTFISFTVQE